MKKFLTLLGLALFLFLGFNAPINLEASNKVDAYLFYGIGCPHCAKEIEFFFSIKDKYPDLTVYTYEVYYNQKNALLLQEVARNLNVDGGGVPFTVIGDESFVGFGEQSSPKELEARINECLVNKCPNETGLILGLEEEFIIEENPITEEVIDKEGVQALTEEGEVDQLKENNEPKSKIMKLPFLGETDIHKLSLPILAVLMGVLDGFNPCALWVLLFLISLLLGMGNKKRMWTLGIVFIIASASVYFIFMAAWLNLVLFLGFIIWVRLFIAMLALFGGGYSLKKFFKNKAGTCEVTGGERKQKIFEKLKNIVKKNNIWVALGGMILLAFAVNLVELICSVGLPAVFTQVLAMNNLSTVNYYLYILLYILFFMIDDLIVFFVAMFTLKMTGITNKYARYSHLIGGAVMILIGILLIFKPEWLMFG
jgi:cytochrome c biogenesis protein CcdA/thiol-disulfide isomerase/thioredoxin